MRIILLILAAMLAPALVVSTANAAKDDTLLVSRAAGPKGAGGDLGSFSPSISADGSLVAFDSTATNLRPDDGDDVSDVFIRGIDDDTLTLVSRAGGASGAAGNDSSYSPALSADGRYVAFASNASNLGSSGGADSSSEIYVRDLQANTTTLVSRATGAGGAAANNSSSDAVISGDGRYVAFVSTADNLSAQDPDDVEDVYVRDMDTKTTRLVTQSAINVPRNGAMTSSPAISADGRYIAFATGRKDLSSQTTPFESGNDVLVRDLKTDKVELVSRATGPAGAPADDDSGHPSLSADGQFVSFHSSASNLAAADDKRFSDVFVRDRDANTTALVSVVPGVPQSEEAGGDSFADSISGDGRYVTFNSNAGGLSPNGGALNDFGEFVVDVYVRDLNAGTTTLVSRASGASGALSNNSSFSSVISSSDGRFVAFASTATNLHPDAVAAAGSGDEDGEEPSADVYLRDVLGGQGVTANTDRPTPAPHCPFKGRVTAGTDASDVLGGTSHTDVMFGLAGNDVLRGRGGRDCIYGQSGRDRVLGQSARDWLWGGKGSDRVDGGRGNDRLRGQDGNDRLIGGSGRDSLLGGHGADRLFGGRGNDRLTDNSGRDHLSGGPGRDRINARDRTKRGRSRPDTVSCGSGSRDIAFVDAADRVALDCERVRVRNR